MSRHNIFHMRKWMYNRLDGCTGEITAEFKQGLNEFMAVATRQEICREQGKMSCPCVKCKNEKFIGIETVWKHLYLKGFTPGYYVWFSHGEDFGTLPSSSDANMEGMVNENLFERVRDECRDLNREQDNVDQMVRDAFRGTIECENVSEEPNAEAKKFFEMLESARNPIYAGCKEGQSALSAASRLMSIKTEWNLAEDCVDAIADFAKDYMPADNIAPGSYYDIQKLVSGLGLPYEMIDVCRDNCMIFWKEDVNLDACRFCGKERFQDMAGKTKLPFQRMWYLPVTDRLKRLYQSNRTASAMRWHGEHEFTGEISHPSDAEAWKHFGNLYPGFAEEARNVYLGLCTDGFNPFGKSGRKYSLWPVILTPYNLPPALCMKREFLFLTILVPGPDHPRRSLDVFLRPLIEELKMLWFDGVLTYDVSKKTNFTMKAVWMWTISDFPAYGMLSGWTTHGRLSCPYCQDSSDAFQLRHGRKSCWFDCHRRFLPENHPYRRSRRFFRKNRVVKDPRPTEYDGKAILDQFRDFDVDTTFECGGNGHDKVGGYGQYHNWHKKSIFWDLPYWKTHLLRHNLDVMHIEKNFFDNIINTVLNVQGKTKDNVKSRLDLPTICARDELHLNETGKAPVPIFRLDASARAELFQWLCDDVKFPDGYASNLGNRVDDHLGRLYGMKSHDCHVFMQRLLPFAFAELLPKNVHESIAGIGAFFRDICCRSLTPNGLEILQQNIPIVLCNLEKIFPPSFFDVMEHLPIHLPREAILGGPVQYRWMYPFERFMFHLKKKVKNLSKVEGSIVAQSINEETSYFSSYYFAPHVQTKLRKPGRYDDGGVGRVYPRYVPTIFSEVGRFSGKKKGVWLTDQEFDHIHTYIIRNCEDLMPYENKFEEQIREAYGDVSEFQMEQWKSQKLAKWLQYYVKSSETVTTDTWLQEFIGGPLSQTISSPMYCTRGYVFRKRTGLNNRKTVNHGVVVRTDTTDYYGEIQEILEIEYPGFLNLKCVLFKCHWFDPTENVGVRCIKFGVTEVHTGRRLNKYDPFILASQADQVSYIPYPRVTRTHNPWVTVTQINPRGRVDGVKETEPLQQNEFTMTGVSQHSVEPFNLVNHQDEFPEDLFDDEVHEETVGEFDNLSESSEEEYSTDDSE